MKKILAALMCVVIVLQLSSCVSTGDTKATKNITAMNTVMQITVFNTSEGTNEDVLNEMVARTEELEKLFDPGLT